MFIYIGSSPAGLPLTPCGVTVIPTIVTSSLLDTASPPVLLQMGEEGENDASPFSTASLTEKGDFMRGQFI